MEFAENPINRDLEPVKEQRREGVEASNRLYKLSKINQANVPNKSEKAREAKKRKENQKSQLKSNRSPQPVKSSKKILKPALQKNEKQEFSFARAIKQA